MNLELLKGNLETTLETFRANNLETRRLLNQLAPSPLIENPEPETSGPQESRGFIDDLTGIAFCIQAETNKQGQLNNWLHSVIFQSGELQQRDGTAKSSI